jgi:hypothetical protein
LRGEAAERLKGTKPTSLFGDPIFMYHALGMLLRAMELVLNNLEPPDAQETEKTEE